MAFKKTIGPGKKNHKLIIAEPTSIPESRVDARTKPL